MTQDRLSARALVRPLIRLVDDDDDFRASQRLFLGMAGFEVEDYASGETFLAEARLDRPGVIVVDLRMPGVDGIEVQRQLALRGCTLPVLFLTGHGDVTTAVHTLKAGAFDFIEKHGNPMALRAAVEKACAESMKRFEAERVRDELEDLWATLTNREREVLLLVSEGAQNKGIAETLGIGVETVKMHRANAFAKLGLTSALDAYRWLERLGLVRGGGKAASVEDALLHTEAGS